MGRNAAWFMLEAGAAARMSALGARWALLAALRAGLRLEAGDCEQALTSSLVQASRPRGLQQTVRGERGCKTAAPPSLLEIYMYEQ